MKIQVKKILHDYVVHVDESPVFSFMYESDAKKVAEMIYVISELRLFVKICQSDFVCQGLAESTKYAESRLKMIDDILKEIEQT